MLELSLKEIKKYYLLPLLSAITTAIPLVLSRFDYQDDMYRTTSGYTDFWFSNGRPFSVWIYRILNQGSITPDTTPLNFILSIAILLLAGFILSNKISSNNLVRVCCAIIFISTPFLTSILSYKYDCLTVSIALFLAVIFNTLEIRSFIFNIAVKIIIIFSIFCIYQPAISMAFGIIGLTILSRRESFNIKSEIYNIALKSAIIALSFVLYKNIISDPYLGDFYKSQGQLIKPNHLFISVLMENVKGYLYNVYLFIKYPYILVPLIISFFSCCFIVSTSNNKLKCQILLSLPFILVAITGCNIILENAAFQAREMLGVQCFIIGVFLILGKAKNKNLIKINLVLLTLGVFITNTTISYTYLNYKDEMERRDQLILSDINKVIINYGADNIIKTYLFYNIAPKSKKQLNMETAYPIINKMIYNKEFSSVWYAQGYLGEENEINLNMEQKHGNVTDPQFRTCFTSSKLIEGTLYLSIEKNCIR